LCRPRRQEVVVVGWAPGSLIGDKASPFFETKILSSPQRRRLVVGGGGVVAVIVVVVLTEDLRSARPMSKKGLPTRTITGLRRPKIFMAPGSTNMVLDKWQGRPVIFVVHLGKGISPCVMGR
jgi:hypothetical protein